jgi:hypothetical protein
VRLGTERGARGGLEDVLTLGGGERGRPEFAVNAGGAWPRWCRAASGAAPAALARLRRRG